MAISGALAETALIKMSNAVVQVDIGGAGSAWANVESWANQVTATRGEIPTSDDPTLDGGRHQTAGIQGKSKVEVTLLYTETTTGPAYNLYTLLGTAVDVRWSKSGASGDLRYYTDNGILVSCTPPQYSANDNGNTKITFAIECPGDIERETMVGTT